MKIEHIYSYRKLNHSWVSKLTNALKKVPNNIFYEERGIPSRQEIAQLDAKLLKLLRKGFGVEVENNFAPMAPENRFSVDFILPTAPKVLIEVEKGKSPRLELDLMKMVNVIWRFPSKYCYACFIVPTTFIRLKLAGRRTPYSYLVNNLIPLNSSILEAKQKSGNSFYIKDLIVIGYVDPRGE